MNSRTVFRTREERMDRLRGVNLGGWLSQIDAIEEKDPERFQGIDHHMATFIETSDFDRIAEAGFNHIRLPVDYDAFFDDDGHPIAHRLPHLDNAFSETSSRNLRLILDLHKCPGHTFHDPTKALQRLFIDESCVQNTLAIWQFLARRYGHFPNAILEVLNEPVAPNAVLWNTLKDRICAAIRQEAPDVPIVVGSNMWNWPSTFADLTPVPDDQVMYSVHFYEPLLFTHQLAPWLPEPEFRISRTWPGDYGPGVIRQYGLVMSSGTWNQDRMTAELEPVLRFRDRHQVAVICNEFGTYVQARREDQLRWTSDFLDVLKSHDIGFSYWNYKNLDFGIISTGEALHRDLAQYDNPDRLDRELLTILRNG